MKNIERLFPSPLLPFFIMLFVVMAGVLAVRVTAPVSVHATAATSTPPQAKQAPYKYIRLFYYQGGALAKKSFLAHAKSIDIFAPQTYGLYDTGELKGSVDPVLLDFAKKNNIKTMPLAINYGFSSDGYHPLLDDPKKQNAAIAALVVEAKHYGYSGWQLDFEQMDAADRDAFSAFVKKVYAAMQENGLMLSVAVFAKTSDNPADYPNDLWRKTIGVYDYGTLAANADFISIMSYDDPFSLGPPAGWLWYKKVLAYSMSKIPAEKISLGIPLYYWLWNDVTGEKIEAGGNEGIQNAFNKRAAVAHYSAKHHVPYLTFYKKGMEYVLWYENVQSVAEKIALIKKNKLHGFSAWALGLERPNVWSAVEQGA